MVLFNGKTVQRNNSLDNFSFAYFITLSVVSRTT